MDERIKVTWNEGKGSNFVNSPREAWEFLATLKMSGFADAEIVWPAHLRSSSWTK